MIRLLVIHQPTEDFENRALVRSLLSATDPELNVTAFELPPSTVTPHAVARLNRLERDSGIDVIHAIGPSSLLAALPVGCQPIVYSPIASDIRRGESVLRWISKLRQVTVAAPSRAAARLLLASRHQFSARAVYTPFQSQAIGAISRQSLGFAEDDRILLAVGECTRDSGHKLAAWTAVIMFCLDARYKLLVSGGPDSARMKRFAIALNQPGFAVFADDVFGERPHFARLAALADLALFTPYAAGGVLAAQICQATQLPIVASPNSLNGELQGGVTVAGSARAKIMAQTVLQQFSETSVTRSASRQVVSAAVNSLEAWIELYNDVLVGRHHFESEATARQS